MGSPFYRVIRGRFVIIGKAPDGDSVRFIADQPALFRPLHRADRIRLARDGSVQLRFEAVDAPELHYGKAAQPLGAEARDDLLTWIGFDLNRIEYDANPSQPGLIRSADPSSLPGAILTQAAEANGRPISYVLVNEATAGLQEGDWIHVGDELLRQTLNWRLLEAGMAYYTTYTSTPLTHREWLQDVARRARNDKKAGVWALDSTSSFELETQDSIGPGGQLILPKLFRRCTDYLKSVEQDGFRGNLEDWLVAHQAGSRQENDSVVVQDHLQLRLSDLLDQRNRTIVFQADLLDIVFVEK